MAALIDAIDVKRKMFIEIEGVPFYCLESETSTPTARGGQTLVRLKMRNMLTRAVFDKTFKASDKFKEPDLQLLHADELCRWIPASFRRPDTGCRRQSLRHNSIGGRLQRRNGFRTITA